MKSEELLVLERSPGAREQVPQRARAQLDLRATNVANDFARLKRAAQFAYLLGWIERARARDLRRRQMSCQRALARSQPSFISIWIYINVRT